MEHRSPWRMVAFVLCAVISVVVIAQPVDPPHGIVEIISVNPRNPRIIAHEEKAEVIEIVIDRRGGCLRKATVGFKCVPLTAEMGQDFTCNEQEFTWEDQDCSLRTAFVNIRNDKIYEEDEQFLVQLYSSPNDIALGFDRVWVVIPRNDLVTGHIVVHPSVASVVEGMPFEFEIQRVDGDVDPARACYQVNSGTAKAIFDVEFKQECFEWKHRDNRSYSVTLQTMMDDFWEADEVFYIKLLNVEGATLDPERPQGNITILQNNLNIPFTETSAPPCDKPETRQDLLIDPLVTTEFFVQFEVRLPSACTVNDAHIILEIGSNTPTSLKQIVLKLNGLIVDETAVSCDNIPAGYELIPPNGADPKEKRTLDCDAIINQTIILDSSVKYTCDQTVDCTNFDPALNSPKLISNDTVLSKRKQRLFCGDFDATTSTIICECDFPLNIFSDDEWGITDFTPSRKYLSRSLKYELRQIVNQSAWDEHSMATFLFTVESHEVDETLTGTTNAIGETILAATRFKVYMVTDAFPCIETSWSGWDPCDASPVGMGHEYKHRIGVHGLPGQELDCRELKQHRDCVVNKEKKLLFSRTSIRVLEGSDGVTFTVRLMHELTNMVNKTSLKEEALMNLRGYDIIVYLEVPPLYQKEIVVDPRFVGWKAEKWDTVHDVKITALDDRNIDALEQEFDISTKVYSRDEEYNGLSMFGLSVTVEDNEKCRYCGLGNIQPFHPSPKPLFWDAKSILILVAFLSMLAFFVWRCYAAFKEKYGEPAQDAQYEKLAEDGLFSEFGNIGSQEANTRSLEATIKTGSDDDDSLDAIQDLVLDTEAARRANKYLKKFDKKKTVKTPKIKGARFEMGNVYYSVVAVDKYIECEQIEEAKRDEFPTQIVLTLQQFNFVKLVKDIPGQKRVIPTEAATYEGRQQLLELIAESLRRKCQRIDRHETGKITTEQLYALLGTLQLVNVEISVKKEPHIQAIVNEKNIEGSIDYNAFLNLIPALNETEYTKTRQEWNLFRFNLIGPGRTEGTVRIFYRYDAWKQSLSFLVRNIETEEKPDLPLEDVVKYIEKHTDNHVACMEYRYASNPTYMPGKRGWTELDVENVKYVKVPFLVKNDGTLEIEIWMKTVAFCANKENGMPFPKNAADADVAEQEIDLKPKPDEEAHSGKGTDEQTGDADGIDAAGSHADAAEAAESKGNAMEEGTSKQNDELDRQQGANDEAAGRDGQGIEGNDEKEDEIDAQQSEEAENKNESGYDMNHPYLKHIFKMQLIAKKQAPKGTKTNEKQT